MTAPHSKPVPVSIALVMAGIAVLGAGAAYLAARAEQNSLREERRLEQGKILELARREELLRRRSYAARYDDRYQLLGAELKALAEARDGTPSEEGRPPLLHFDIQETAAIQRSLAPLRQYFGSSLSAETLEDDLKEDAAEQLRGYGFDTEWVEKPPDGQSRPSIWHRLEARVHHEHTKVVGLALSVLLFVLALASFTFAQLSGETPRARSFQTVGYAVGVVAVGLAIWFDLAALYIYALSLGGLLLLAPVGWAIARYFGIASSRHAEIAHLGEFEPKGFVGMRIPTPHGDGRLHTFTIAAIAITAILSAASGWFYSLASTSASISGTEALEHQAELFRKTARIGTELYDQVIQLGTLSEDRLRMDAATQRLALAQELGVMSPREAKERLDAARRQFNMHYERRAPKLEAVFDGPIGPYNDPGFPRQFVSSVLVREEAATFALWDASSEASVKAQRRATIYLGLLTLFAVGLYLFGQSLSMGATRSAFILVFASCWLVVIGSVGATVAVFRSFRGGQPAAPTAECLAGGGENETAVERAARHYGQGRMQLAIDKPKEAVGALQCAVQARPTFALANYFLSLATTRAASPQINEGGFISIVSPAVLPGVQRYQEQAVDSLRDQGFLPPSTLQGNSGFDGFLLALINKDREGLERSIAATKEAIESDDSNPITQFNLVLALLANGQKDEADTVFKRGLELKPSRATVGGAITDLNILHQHCDQVNTAEYCSALRPKLRELQLQLVAALWPAKGGAPSSQASVSEIRLMNEPAGLEWNARIQNLAKDDLLVVLWYAHDMEWNVWRVLPAISGPVLDSTKRRAMENGRANEFKTLLTATTVPDCLRAGKYQAEFYVNGRLAATSPEMSAKHGAFNAVAFGDLNLAMCHPPDWKAASGLAPGLMRAFTDGQTATKRGAYLFTYFSPFGAGDAGDGRRWRFIQRAAAYIAARPVEFRQIQTCGSYRANTGDLMAESTDAVGMILARTWTRSDGLVHVGLVLDERLDSRASVAQARAEDPAGADCATLVSMTNLR